MFFPKSRESWKMWNLNVTFELDAFCHFPELHSPRCSNLEGLLRRCSCDTVALGRVKTEVFLLFKFKFSSFVHLCPKNFQPTSQSVTYKLSVMLTCGISCCPKYGSYDLCNWYHDTFSDVDCRQSILLFHSNDRCDEDNGGDEFDVVKTNEFFNKLMTLFKTVYCSC